MIAGWSVIFLSGRLGRCKVLRGPGSQVLERDGFDGGAGDEAAGGCALVCLSLKLI